MYEPENENLSENAPSAPQSGEDGGYAYGEFARDTIYSDAHFTPEGESAVPPRYYTPPEPKKAPKREKSGKGGKILGLIALCLVCALLGGLVGASFMGGQLSGRIDALEQQHEEEAAAQLFEAERDAAAQDETSAPSAQSGSAVPSAADIYAQACEQVVGVTTEVTYTNFFGMNSSSAVSGTGFIVSEDGYILTNYHVIEYAAQGALDVTVILHDGTRYTASIIGYEKYNDVALLKIDANGLKPVTFGDSAALSVGDLVYAVGNPLGELDFSMSTGHVSALDRAITSDESGIAINMFQIDAAVNSGNSGGPVYDAAGRVVGIVTAKYASTGVEGLGFAIPINDASKIAVDLMTKGYVTGKAYMGVEIDSDYNSAYGQYYASYWNMPSGAYVKKVSSGTAAEKAGLQPKDIITRLGDQEVRNYSDLTAALHGFSAGETTQITVYRGGQEMSFSITFDEAKG